LIFAASSFGAKTPICMRLDASGMAKWKELGSASLEVSMTERSPIHEIEQAAGARFGTHFSWEIAEDFGDPLREYGAVRDECGALDLCHVGKLRATGRDRVRYLHNMLSNDIKALRAGSGCYATLLTRQGQIEADLHVYAFPDHLWLECAAAGTGKALETLDRYIVGDVVTIENMTPTLCTLSLQGPKSREKMEASLGHSLVGMAPLEHRDFARGFGTWVVIRRDRTGCDGYDLWLPREDAPALWSQWVGMIGIQPVGYTAHNLLRTEAGIPWYGIDMTDRNLPMEMGLDAAISLTKGCYRGQEIVARITHRAHLDRKLAAVVVDGSTVPQNGAEVQTGGAKIGNITSAVFSPRLGRPLALCVLKAAYLDPGTRVEVASGNEVLTGKVIGLPL
jgi:folate-binding protein YgfZ